MAGPFPDGVVLPPCCGVVLPALWMMSILDLLFIKLEEPVPDLGPVAGLTPRPPLAPTFLPGFTIFPAGARELFRLSLGFGGDFLMTGPFLGGSDSSTEDSEIMVATGTFLAAETFLKLLAIEDLLSGVTYCLLGVEVASFSESEPDFSPADSFMACSKTLTRSRMGEPV